MYMYSDSNQRLPTALTQLTGGNVLDPWGRPYRYVPFTGTSTDAPRQDRFSVASNADYDLYSLGEDGETAVSFTEAVSHDDVVRADNGGYIGLAGEF